ncbi:RICIN domain-containing protein [Streptomyces vinaceus]|uniref:RICIN domain-containing protein n=1 Tax=Streptomyces vinaceus TaxID=1960 RepID=UPI00381A0F58
MTLTAGTAVGNPVTAQAFGPANAYQKWTIAKTNGTLKLTNPQTGLVVDINGKTISAGTAVTTVWSGSANSQSWAALP